MPPCAEGTRLKNDGQRDFGTEAGIKEGAADTKKTAIIVPRQRQARGWGGVHKHWAVKCPNKTRLVITTVLLCNGQDLSKHFCRRFNNTDEAKRGS